MRENELVQQLETGLEASESKSGVLLGIAASQRRAALVRQLVESVRRVRFVSVIRSRPISDGRLSPLDGIFDPIRAAAVHSSRGALDEACWLVFLSVHFGRHVVDGWKLAARVYAGGGDRHWTWDVVSNEPQHFVVWLESASAEWKAAGLPVRFGNHRKYQSLDARKKNGTGHAITSYVEWVLARGDHAKLFGTTQDVSDVARFETLFQSMEAVASFGRMARFDYLTMLAKLGLAPIKPGRPYLDGATGPLRGARLLIANDINARLSTQQLEHRLIALGEELGVGMQEIEDAICNWQKSPNVFQAFRG